MKCIKCGNEIPEGRLKALPNTITCTECSGVSKVAGFALIEGKNEYSQLQIVSQEQAEELHKKQQRVGYGASNGMKGK